MYSYIQILRKIISNYHGSWTFKQQLLATITGGGQALDTMINLTTTHA